MKNKRSFILLYVFGLLIIGGVLVHAITTDYGWGRLALPDPDNGLMFVYSQASAQWRFGNSSTNTTVMSVDTNRVALGTRLGSTSSQTLTPSLFTVVTTFSSNSGNAITFTTAFAETPAAFVQARPANAYTVLTSYVAVLETLNASSATIRVYSNTTVLGVGSLAEAEGGTANVTAVFIGR